MFYRWLSSQRGGGSSGIAIIRTRFPLTRLLCNLLFLGAIFSPLMSEDYDER